MINSKRVLKLFSYIAVVLVVAALATTLGILADKVTKRENELEAMYQKAYYESVDVLNNLELNLSKLQISQKKATQTELLTQLRSDALVAESNLSTLMNASPDNSELIAFINKLGDYAKALAAADKTLEAEDKQTISELYNIIVNVKQVLESVKEEILNGNTLLSGIGGSLNYLGDAFDNISSAQIEIPQLIYDGPFSDALDDRETKLLNGAAEITAEEAAVRVGNLFGTTATLQFVTEADIPSYVFALEGKQDSIVYITKAGGYIYLYNNYVETQDTIYTDEEYIEIGKNFLAGLGYSDMQEVWISNNNSTVYVNYAPINGDTVLYPDIMIVKIAGDSGEIIGLEGKNYIYNHTERTLPSPRPVEEAQAAISADVIVTQSRLALIPTDWNTEILTYEFEVTYAEQVYYIYVDAVTLEEIKIMRVVEDDGRLIA